MKRAVPKISGGAALWASASPLSARWPEPWTQLPALSPVGLVLGSEADHLQAGTCTRVPSSREPRGQAQCLGEVLFSVELLG